jgi:hypothetical protein
MTEEKSLVKPLDEPVEDENPLKKKKPFVLTPARSETLKKGREKRMANIKKLQEEKARKHQEEKEKKREVKDEVKQEVEKRISGVTLSAECDTVQKKAKSLVKKKVNITIPSSDSEQSDGDDDYEIEIKKKPRERVYRYDTQVTPNIILV